MRSRAPRRAHGAHRAALLLSLLQVSCAPPATPADAGLEDARDDVRRTVRTVAVFDRVRIGSQSGAPNFQQSSSDFDFGAGPFARATLVVDLDTSCFPFERWRENAPPAGQNFPADCDAFDRNFEFTLDEPQRPGDAPALELVRSITPFGGPLHYEVDVTDLANGRPGAHRLRTFISTYSDAAGQVTGSNGGWWVSARFELESGPAPRRVLAVLPLVNGTVGPEGRSAPEVAFEVPSGATGARLEYRVTGHGGGRGDARYCIGPAEEFCSRSHRLTLDGEDLSGELLPWREDCATLCTWVPRGTQGFCMQNPTGLRQSVEAPRANWCPGSVTPPFVFERALAPGRHAFRYEIDQIASGGSWRTSATLYIFGP